MKKSLLSLAVIGLVLLLAPSLMAQAASVANESQLYRGLVDNSLRDITCLSDKICLAVGASQNDQPLIMRSVNGGTSWSKISLVKVKVVAGKDDSGLYSIACPDSKNCLAVGQEGMVWRTTNAGLTWKLLNSPLAKVLSSDVNVKNIFYDISCLPKTKTCFMVGESALYEDENSKRSISNDSMNPILKTINFGDKWSNIESDSVNELFTSLSFISEKVGYLSGANGMVFNTNDGGATWNYRQIDANRFTIITTREDGDLTTVPGDAYPLLDVKMLDANKIFAVGAGVLASSTDSGLYFTAQKFNNIIYSLDFSDKNNGLAVGSEGLILRTKDGGQNWTKTNVVTKKEALVLNSVYCQKNKTCLATGAILNSQFKIYPVIYKIKL